MSKWSQGQRGRQWSPLAPGEIAPTAKKNQWTDHWTTLWLTETMEYRGEGALHTSALKQVWHLEQHSSRWPQWAVRQDVQSFYKNQQKHSWTSQEATERMDLWHNMGLNWGKETEKVTNTGLHHSWRQGDTFSRVQRKEYWSEKKHQTGQESIHGWHGKGSTDSSR